MLVITQIARQLVIVLTLFMRMQNVLIKTHRWNIVVLLRCLLASISTSHDPWYVATPTDVARYVVPCQLSPFDQKFPEALEAYSEAIELDNTNMSFLSNKAAVFFEQKEYEACIAEVSGFLRDAVSLTIVIL